MVARTSNTIDDEFTKAIAEKIGEETFWLSGSNKYVSTTTLKPDTDGSEPITLVMTEYQFGKLLGMLS